MMIRTITQNEIILSPSDTIQSRTDIRGVIDSHVLNTDFTQEFRKRN